MNIALIKTGALGDVVRTTSLVPALLRRHPGAHITWITSRAALPLVVGVEGCHATTIDAPAAAAWRGESYDWIISLDDDGPSCALARSLHGAKLSGAYVDAAGRRAYTRDVEPWFGMGLLRDAGRGGLDAANALKRANTRTYGELLYQSLGLPLPVDRPTVPLTRKAERSAADWLNAHAFAPASIVGLNTGAGGRWRFKNWPVDASAVLARRLGASGATVVVLGGPAERERNAEICAAAAHPRVLLAPTDLDVLAFAALVARCDVLVCSDSLAMHLAIAADRAVVALFGPTSDAEIDLFGRGRKIVANVPCRRCYLSTCDVRPTCMDMISVGEVAAAVAELSGRAEACA